jgi:hypothetical protein
LQATAAVLRYEVSSLVATATVVGFVGGYLVS